MEQEKKDEAVGTAGTGNAQAPIKREKNAKKLLNKMTKGGKGFFNDFKTFINKGNIMQLAVAFIMGTAFTVIVTSLVNDFFMPILGLIIGGIDISNLSFTVGTLTVVYGKFILAVVNFLLVALVLFIVVKIMTRAGKGIKKLKKGQVAPPPAPPAAPVLTKSEQLLTDIKALLIQQNGAQEADGKESEQKDKK